MYEIAPEHFCHVPTTAVKAGDQIVVGGFVGQVNRIESSGPDYFILPTYAGDAAPTDGSVAGVANGWYFHRVRLDGTVKVYAPRFCGGRSLELRRLAAKTS